MFRHPIFHSLDPSSTVSLPVASKIGTHMAWYQSYIHTSLDPGPDDRFTGYSQTHPNSLVTQFSWLSHLSHLLPLPKRLNT